MSIPTLVFRVVSRTELAGHLRDHIVGVTRPATAIERAGWPRVETLIGHNAHAPHATVHAGLADRASRDALREGRTALADATLPKRGRRPAPLVDVIVAGGSAFERLRDSDPEPWSLEKTRRWALRALAAVRRGLGRRSVVTAAAWHGDERSPHLHVQAVPIASDGRLGWSHVRAEWAQRAGLAPPEAEPVGEYTRRVKRDGEWVEERREPFTAAQVARSRERRSAEMSAVQDFMHARVGARYGLARGERGSRRRHQAVNRTLAAEERAVAVEAEARRVEERTRQARSRAESWAAVGDVEHQRAHAEAEKAEAEEQRLADARHERAEVEAQYNAKRRELRALERDGEARRVERERVEAELAQLREDGRRARESLERVTREVACAKRRNRRLRAVRDGRRRQLDEVKRYLRGAREQRLVQDWAHEEKAKELQENIERLEGALERLERAERARDAAVEDRRIAELGTRAARERADAARAEVSEASVALPETVGYQRGFEAGVNSERRRVWQEREKERQRRRPQAGLG